MAAIRPPKSVQFLNKWVDSYARELGQPPVRVRNWVSHMIVGGALQTAGSGATQGKFTIKGGVALEMRLRYVARATRDLDVIFEAADEDPLEVLEEALAEPYQGFTFRRKGPVEVLPNGAARVDVALAYRGKPWGTVQVDVTRREPGRADVEMVEAFSLAPFGLQGPDSLPCLSLPYHVAQKIHAATFVPRDGRRNERFRDLIDLVLLRGWVTDHEAVKWACLDVFETRGTHPWPPLLSVPEHWEAPYRRMATELGMEPVDAYEAALLVRRFINSVDASAKWVGELSSLSGLTATTWYFAWKPDGRFQRIPATVGESFFRSCESRADAIGPDLQRNPGGLALFGVVLLLRDRRPVYVDGNAFGCFALDESSAGVAVEFGGDSWNHLAEAVLIACKAPLRAVADLAVFLGKTQCFLPCQLADLQAESTAGWHWKQVNWRWNWFLWDLEKAEPVQSPSSDRED